MHDLYSHVIDKCMFCEKNLVRPIFYSREMFLHNHFEKLKDKLSKLSSCFYFAVNYAFYLSFTTKCFVLLKLLNST